MGDGIFSPVLPAVWGYEVSGLQVVRSWLDYRMAKRSGRKSSPLDEIRPERWSAEFTEELLELLWVLEATVALLPELEENLSSVVASPTFAAGELPAPSPEERRPPEDEKETGQPGTEELRLDV